MLQVVAVMAFHCVCVLFMLTLISAELALAVSCPNNTRKRYNDYMTAAATQTCRLWCIVLVLNLRHLPLPLAEIWYSFWNSCFIFQPRLVAFLNRFQAAVDCMLSSLLTCWPLCRPACPGLVPLRSRGSHCNSVASCCCHWGIALRQ